MHSFPISRHRIFSKAIAASSSSPVVRNTAGSLPTNYTYLSTMSSNTPLESIKQPPRTIRIKRPRDETPVTSLYLDDTTPGDSKRIKTSTPQTPAYIFRLAHTVPTPFQPIATTSSSPIPPSDRPPAVQDARKTLKPQSSTERLSQDTSRASTPLKRKLGGDVDEDSVSSSIPSTPASTSKDGLSNDSGDKGRPGAVRRFVLTRETKRKRMHPYRAIFERLHDTPPPSSPNLKAVDGSTSVKTAISAIDDIPAQPPSPPRKRKLPGIRKDPVERARLQKLQSEQQEKESQAPPFKSDDGEFDLSEEMRRMVLDYLEEDSRNALGGLPPTSADRVGGGLGGGTWDDTKEEDEKNFVYDVYIREEVTAENAKAPEKGENVGVIVFRGEEDEEWWYENADEDDPDDFAFDTDDEDSNAEDYIANEYPDEDEYEWASEDEDRDLYADEDQENRDPLYTGPSLRWNSRRAIGSDEEYDLENDSSDEEQEERLKRYARGILA